MRWHRPRSRSSPRCCGPASATGCATATRAKPSPSSPTSRPSCHAPDEPQRAAYDRSPVKAAVYYDTGPPEVFRYEDVADPVCTPGCVVIDVEAISIEGGDTFHRAGGEMTSTPHIVGYQCAGTIREVGAGVEDRRVGQRVVATMLSGSHAERVAVPALVTWLVPDDGDI